MENIGLLIALFLVFIIAGLVPAIFLNIRLRSLLKPVYKKKLIAYWLLLSMLYVLVLTLIINIEYIVLVFGYNHKITNDISFLFAVLYAFLIGYLAAKKIKQYIELSNKSNIASTDIDQRSMIHGEKAQEPSTVKLETKSGRAVKKGYDPKSAKKKVPIVVWFLSLLGLVLVIVVVHQYNEQQRLREQNKRARIEEQRRIEEQQREEERKAQEAERQRRLAEEQRQREEQARRAAELEAVEERQNPIRAWEQRYGTKVVEVTNPATGRTWMDRNLGASRAATSSTDAQAYGDLYQWGRASDGHQRRNSRTTSTLSSNNTPGHGNFILNHYRHPYDWRSPQNNSLWQGVNGVNNPCPPGYRLPTENEWQAERRSWSSNNAAGAFASPLKLPVAGARYSSDGWLHAVGSRGYYWSSNVGRVYSRHLFFLSSNANMSSYQRAVGRSVRCIKDGMRTEDE